MNILYKKTKIFISFLTIIFIILFLSSAFYQRNEMLNKYMLAQEQYNNENYNEAQKLFEELGNYKDSFDYIELSYKGEIYTNGITLMSEGNYEDAIELFNQIQDYKNSKKFIDECNNLITEKNMNDCLYNEAYNYYESNEYILAIQEFGKLNNYKDSKEMLQKCQLELAKLQQATTISAGIRSSVGMIRNGKVYLAGDDDYSWKSELDSWNDIISISVKGNFVLGLKEDGTVVMAGNVPKYYVGTKTWNDIISVAAGQQYIIGLREDGTVVAQGHNGDGQVDIDEWHDIVAIATGWRHTVGLDSDGNIIITGLGSDKQLKYIKENADDWNDIVAISAGGGASTNNERIAYTVALKQNGTVVTTLTGEIADEIGKWNDIIAISAGDSHIVGLKSDHTVVTTQTGQSAEDISKWTDIVAISAGYNFTLGLKSDGTVVAAGYDHNGQSDVYSWKYVTNYEKEWQSIFDENLRWNGNK